MKAPLRFCKTLQVAAHLSISSDFSTLPMPPTMARGEAGCTPRNLRPPGLWRRIAFFAIPALTLIIRAEVLVVAYDFYIYPFHEHVLYRLG
jgi:hypothetical protein